MADFEVNEGSEPAAGDDLWHSSWRTLRHHPAGMIGLIGFGLLLVVVLLAPLLAPADPTALDIAHALQAPGKAHLFGTDDLGRDVFSRVLWGGRESLRVALIAIVVAALGGITLGLTSGYFGGVVDGITMRVVDVFLAFPTILLLLSIVAALGPSLGTVLIAVGISFIPNVARFVRSNVLAVRNSEYVTAARLLGADDRYIMGTQILPNILAPLIVYSTIGLGSAIMLTAGLSYLGLGAQPPSPEWGAMLNYGRNYLRDAWWMSVFPGLAMFAAVLFINLLGDGLRDALDPKLPRLMAPGPGGGVTRRPRSPSPFNKRGNVTHLLEVSNLSVRFYTHQGVVHAVNGISLSVSEGEVVGIVGESGSGKSVSMLSVLRLIPDPPGRIESGEVVFNGRDLLKLNEQQMEQVRGAEIAMIFQDPLTSLNPTLTVGRQIGEALRLHQGMDRRRADERAAELLSLVGIPKARERLGDYPHQFSGGMRQRVMIAMALSCSPKLLIADEPTTALDVTVQAQIVELVRRLREQLGMSLLWITHDLGMVARLAYRVIVMYAGYIVEEAPVDDLFATPHHPYTAGLLASLPRLNRSSDGKLFSIPGQPPDLLKMSPGCPFEPRCAYQTERCQRENPVLAPVAGLAPHGGSVACWNPRNIEGEASRAQ